MKSRSFKEVLAECQGGIRLKPGHSYSTELTEAEVREIFGEVPVARAGYGLIVNIRKMANGKLRITVRITE